MSNIVRIPQDVTIVVCDVKKALFLRNAGPATAPDLQVDETIQNDLDEEEAGLSGPPGRRFDGGAAAMSDTSRSAMEMPDIARKRRDDFAERLVTELVRRHRSAPVGGLILVAPPALLGSLRRKMNHDLAKLVRAEVPKELADMPVADIAKALTKAL